MKNLIVVAIVALFATSAMAHGRRHHRHHGPKRKMSKTIVVGKKAQAIFEALTAEVKEVDRPKFSVEVKKVASLRCAKRTKKEDTSIVKFRCALAAKKAPGRRGPRSRRWHRN